MNKAEFEIEEETPTFYIDGITGHIEPGTVELMLFETDSEPEFNDDDHVDWKNTKHSIQTVLKMSPLTLQRMAVFLNRLLQDYEERMQKMEEEEKPEKMFG